MALKSNFVRLIADRSKQIKRSYNCTEKCNHITTHKHNWYSCKNYKLTKYPNKTYEHKLMQSTERKPVATVTKVTVHWPPSMGSSTAFARWHPYLPPANTLVLWAHQRQYPKQHLGWFSCFCRAHVNK